LADSSKSFADFAQFADVGISNGGSECSSMARINDQTVRLTTDSAKIVEFDVRTGAALLPATSVGGTRSPSSGPFASSFGASSFPQCIFGASGDGNDWCFQCGLLPALRFDPASASFVDGFQSASSSAWRVHPSAQFPVSDFTPNDGKISAYGIIGVSTQTQCRRKLSVRVRFN
jgi:hypothetical protein